ncbi:19631_t:CDS:1, partial [Gigaspora rosea]
HNIFVSSKRFENEVPIPIHEIDSVGEITKFPRTIANVIPRNVGNNTIKEDL